jgi:UDP-glucose 4-epimerase
VNRPPGPGPFTGKRVLVTGGTGSLGKVLVRRILGGELGEPEEVVAFSRDEGKQHRMRVLFSGKDESKTGLDYRALKADKKLRFVIGDVRDQDALDDAVFGMDMVFHAAALKQVPSCEYHPAEAVKTNVLGALNLVKALNRSPKTQTAVGVSTDKACKPVNVMGMSKAIMERIFQQDCSARISCVRYGNVLASRGSVLPLFHHQAKNGGPITVTDPEMTRFFLTLDHAVTTVFMALLFGSHGQTWVPRVRAAKIQDMAEILSDHYSVPVKSTAIRPGEKLHEELVSEEEGFRTFEFDPDYFVIQSATYRYEAGSSVLAREPIDEAYSSKDCVMDQFELYDMLSSNGLVTGESLTEKIS